MTATIEMWNPGDVVATLVGKKYTTTISKYVVQNVPARIQPIRASVHKASAVNPTEVQNFLVSMPVTSRVPVLLGTRMRVVSSPLNPTLEDLTFSLREISDSSNPLEWTLVFTVDTGLVSG